MKIKYLFYIGVATLALSGCNDGFLERAPEAINDKTFWNTTGDLETYANQFYSYLPGGVTSIAGPVKVTIRCPTVFLSSSGIS